MNSNDFAPENIDLRAIKIEEAYNAAADKFYAEYETEDFSENDVNFFDGIQVDWFDKSSNVLEGKTPREYIKDAFGEKPNFEKAIEIIKPFFFDDKYIIPKELAEIVKSYDEFEAWAIEFVELLEEEKENEDLLIAACTFFTLVAAYENKKLIDEALKLYDELHGEGSEAARDAIAMMLATTETGTLAVAEKALESEQNDNVFTLLSNASVSAFHNENLYKAIRNFCKKAPEEYKPGCYFMFSDYGDNRAVSFLRTQAKKYKELWLSGENPKENQDNFYTVAQIVARLGGNTEDLD